MTARSDSNVVDWSWLQDTYWYVPPGNLPALQLDPDSDILSWVIDQTVWHITGYRDGYFWGSSTTLMRQQGSEVPAHGPGSHPVCFAMFGSITPEGRIHLTFILDSKASSGPPTIGIGRAVPQENDWRLEMQMSSGTRNETAHWAYMTRVRPGDPAWDSLPGVGLSVPEMLKRCHPN